MPIVFAAGVSHAPGITGWPEEAPVDQKNAIYDGYAQVARDLAATDAEVVVIFSSEHWTNFFFEHIPAFCIGRAEHYDGPVEPWLRIPRTRVPGDPKLAAELLETLYADGVDPSYSDELELDHGTMVPIHFLLSDNPMPVLPILLNTLSWPMPSSESCYRFGEAVGAFLANHEKKIAVIATGGLSHAPGERRHGVIDDDFDSQLIADLTARNDEALRNLSHERMNEAGGGAHEVRAWIALAGAVQNWKGRVIAYEAVRPWATGYGLIEFEPAA